MKLSRIATVAAGLLLTYHAGAAPIQWTSGSGGNDHWYEFIAGTFTSDEAHADAASMSHLGLTGYVTTITSAEENTFVFGLTGGQIAWLSGTDALLEGTFVFNSGPESGEVMTYLPFWTGEPNNENGAEHHLHMNLHLAAGVPGAGGFWNDIPEGFTSGYVVEYSEVPAPSTLAGMAFGLIGLSVVRRRKIGATATHRV